jgi:hypothetical protein
VTGKDKRGEILRQWYGTLKDVKIEEYISMLATKIPFFVKPMHGFHKQTKTGFISNQNRYQCQAPTLFNPIVHSTAVLKYRYYDTVVRCISTLLYKKKSKAQNLVPREVTGEKRPFSAYHRHQSLLPSMQKKRMVTTDDPEDNKQPALIKIFDGISLLFSYCIQFLGVAFSLGLVLYLCGFGYTFDLDNGLEIDRIENMRRELQFRREIVRSSNSPPDN